MYNKQNSNSKVVNEIDNLFLKLQKDDGMLFDNDLKKALSVIVNKNSASELKDTFFDKNSNGEIADKLATKFDSLNDKHGDVVYYSSICEEMTKHLIEEPEYS